MGTVGNDNDRFTSYVILALSLEGSIRRSYMVPTIGIALYYGAGAGILAHIGMWECLAPSNA